MIPTWYLRVANSLFSMLPNLYRKKRREILRWERKKRRISGLMLRIWSKTKEVLGKDGSNSTQKDRSYMENFVYSCQETEVSRIIVKPAADNL